MTNHPPPSALPDDRRAGAFADALREQRSRAQEFLAALGERQRRAEERLEAWIRACSESDRNERPSSGPPVDAAELEALRYERNRMERQLFETERQLRETADRLATAEQQLARALESLPEGAGRRREAGGVLDWESEKRRILAALEAECGAEGEGAPASTSSGKNRLEIAAVLRRTDAIVADKDREITELKQLLRDQSANLGSVAVGAAAVGDVLDRDAIILEERENLRRLRAEWEEKLRKAEIEISLERAKLARQHADLEERLRTHGGVPQKPGVSGTAAAKPDKSSGRWLARLGLKEPSDP